jgi:tRNA(fMet)-specific endonuclease VapC
MLRYMLDTNFCIHVIKVRPEKLRQRFNRFAEQICISSITLGELYYGAEKSRKQTANFAAIEQICGQLTVLPFGDRPAHHFARIKCELEREGKPIGPYDLLIAGHARSEGLTLVTDNAREFSRVQGLQIENWI